MKSNHLDSIAGKEIKLRALMQTASLAISSHFLPPEVKFRMIRFISQFGREHGNRPIDAAVLVLILKKTQHSFNLSI